MKSKKGILGFMQQYATAEACKDHLCQLKWEMAISVANMVMKFQLREELNFIADVVTFSADILLLFRYYFPTPS